MSAALFTCTLSLIATLAALSPDGEAPAPASAPAPAAQPELTHPAAAICKMAVMDLKAGDGFTDKGAAALTDVITTVMGERSGCEVLSRSEIRSMVSFEAEKQLLGCGDESCLAELGGALGVEFLITGSVSMLGESTLLSLKQLNLESLKVEKRVTDTFNGVDDEVVGFTRWMALRLAAGDEVAGAKPIPRPKPEAVAQGSGKVHFVEKEMTLWRGLAWTGLGLTALTGLATGAAAGTVWGSSVYLEAEKQRAAPDAPTVRSIEEMGPPLASLTNLGMYLSGALLVTTVVLFFLPGENVVTREASVPTPETVVTEGGGA